MTDKYDEIGPWTEVKLDIIKNYALEYSRILNNQSRLYHIYIDAFAGAGKYITKRTREFVPGSPLNALLLEPPFKEYHFIDIEESKIKSLKEISEESDNVYIYEGDCNEILIKKILPEAKYEDYRRALCILDPYGLHLTWEVVRKIGEMRSIEIFLNFPLLDMNRNVLLRRPEKIDSEQKKRMNIFWGDNSWEKFVYEERPTFFGVPLEKRTNYKEIITEEYKKRLKEIAGFKYVPQPMQMYNSKNGTLYYLFFASHKPVAQKIVEHIFKKYSWYRE